MSQNELFKKQFDLKLAERESEYTTTEEVRVFCGTFNLNGKSPDEDLKPWLFPTQKKVDVYAIGFEEVVDLNTTSFLLQSDWLERENKWIKAVDDALCNFENAKLFLNLTKKVVKYRRIVKYRMFGIMVLIYVNEAVDHTMISEIFTAEVPTGIMETLGNKGSVGISFKLNETRFCFVCSHLASDTKQLQKRNADYRSSRQRLKFEWNASQDCYDLDNGHEVVFWFGDFNYRVDNVSLSQTIECIYTNEIDRLVEFDQLTIERRKGTVFDDFNEGYL
jgi:hypothetical protein